MQVADVVSGRRGRLEEVVVREKLGNFNLGKSQKSKLITKKNGVLIGFRSNTEISGVRANNTTCFLFFF